MKSTPIPSDKFLVSEIELSYNPKLKPSDRIQINTPSDFYKLLSQEWNMNKFHFVEQFKVIFLNHSNRVLGIFEVSTGGLTSTVVDVRLIFSAALLANATRIVLAHNHPSGALRPSQADIRMTKKLQDAGNLLEIQVIDHIILSSEGYYSFAEQGLI